jgi:uncharacterized membrane protein YfcA
VVFAAGVGAGLFNGVAGGGTMLSFPTLLALGAASITANVTTSVGVLPSYVGGIRGYRHQLSAHRALVRRLVPSCVLGAITGCALLLAFPSSTFRAVLPFLVGVGTVLFGVAPLVTRRLAHLRHDHPGRRVSLAIGIFLVAIYGGYFGAGLGILLLAVMALTLPLDLAELQGLRNALSVIINLCAGAVFLLRGHLIIRDVLGLMVGTLLGGVIGTSLLKRLPPTAVRVIIVAIGALTTFRLAW